MTSARRSVKRGGPSFGSRGVNKHTERTRNPIRFLSGFAVVANLLIGAPALAQQPAPVCHSQSVNVEAANKTHVGITDAAGASLCLYRGPTAIQLEVRRTSIAAILLAMADSYDISFRSSVPLSELKNGRYVGPLGSVISEVLRGYDYAISHQHSHLDIIVFDKNGARPVASPLTAEPIPAAVSEARPPRAPVTVSRAH
jgi:hypothetical protein